MPKKLTAALQRTMRGVISLNQKNPDISGTKSMVLTVIPIKMGIQYPIKLSGFPLSAGMTTIP